MPMPQTPENCGWGLVQEVFSDVVRGLKMNSVCLRANSVSMVAVTHEGAEADPE